MQITVTKTVDVERCIDCPHFYSDMDGGACRELERIYGVYNGFVLPEGRYAIHNDCPFIPEDEKV